MSYYITIKEFQEYLKRHYLIYGHPTTVHPFQIWQMTCLMKLLSNYGTNNIWSFLI